MGAQCIRGVSPTSACWRKLDRIHTHFAWLTLCRFNDSPSQRMRWLRCKQPLRVPSKRSAEVSMAGVMGSEVNWLCGDRIGVPAMGLVAKGDSIRDKRNMNGGLHPVFRPTQIYRLSDSVEFAIPVLYVRWSVLFVHQALSRSHLLFCFLSVSLPPLLVYTSFLTPLTTILPAVHTATTNYITTAHIDRRSVHRTLSLPSLMDSLLPSNSHDLHSPAPSALTRALGLTQQRPIVVHMLCHALYGMSFDTAS